MKDLKLQLIVQALDRATAPLRKVSEALAHVREHTEKLHHALHKLGLAEFVGAAFFTGAGLEAGKTIFELTDRVAELGEAALHNADKTGASVEAMQRWSWAAKQTGVDAENVVRAFGMMESHLSNALTGNKESINALGLLGIKMKEVKALSKDPDKMFARVMEGFEKIKNPFAFARVARDIFGRQWQDLAPILKMSKDELAELFEQLKRAHVIMTDADAKAGDKFIQTKRNMGLAIEGLSIRIGRALLPKLMVAIEKMTDWIESLSDDAVRSFANSIATLADDFVMLLPKLQGLVEGGVKLADQLLKLSTNAALVKTAFAVLVAFMAAQALVAFVSTAASLASVGLAALQAVPLVLSLIPGITGLTSVMAALNVVMDTNPIGVLALAIGAVIAVIGLLSLGIWEIGKHWDEIVAGFENGCRSIEGFFADLEHKLPPWLQGLLKTGGAILTFQFPALSGLGLGVAAMQAAAPANPGAPPARQAPVQPALVPSPRHNPGAPPARQAPVQPALVPSPRHFGSSAWTGPSGRPAPRGGEPPAARAGGHLGTIVVEAAPGTAVKKVKSARDDIDIRHYRGVVPG